MLLCQGVQTKMTTAFTSPVHLHHLTRLPSINVPRSYSQQHQPLTGRPRPRTRLHNYSAETLHRATTSAPSCVWVERSANVIIDNMNSGDCFDCYSDLQSMPKWSPWLKSVVVDKVDRDISRWTLAAKGMEVSWKAQNTKVVRGEIIAWRSLTGLKNRGRVQFENIKDRGCRVTLAIEFDVPSAMASAIDNDYVGRFVEETLGADLKRFRSIALRYRRQLSIDERRQSS